MARRRTIAVVFGTRPEVIKLFPVVRALKRRRDIRCVVCVTGQHREMLDRVMKPLGIRADVDLDLMRPGQLLNDLAAGCVAGLGHTFERVRPDMVLVQGDTTSAFAASLAAFHLHVPVGHVEAGLRTGNLESPWPEEANRQLIARLASLHFAPTAGNARNLREEGITASRIHVTGNTGIDALRMVFREIRQHTPSVEGMGQQDNSRAIVLITTHRRENLGPRMRGVMLAVRELCRRFLNTTFVYPVHLNPAVRKTVKSVFGRKCPGNLLLLQPLPYHSFVYLLSRSVLVLTDSGGLQEEAPSLGRPVLVLRDNTERPEGVRARSVRVVGVARDAVVRAAADVLRDTGVRRTARFRRTSYGDGRSAERIVAVCVRFLKARPEATRQTR